MYNHSHLKVTYAPIYRCLRLKPRNGRLFCSGAVQVHKALYLGHYTPFQMNGHSFCTISNALDCGIAINAIVCKVMMLLFHMHINTRLYIFRNKRTYCYILFSKPQWNTSFKIFLTPNNSHDNYLSTHISKGMIIHIWRSHMHKYIDVWAPKPKPAASSVVVRYKCIKLYISANIQPILMNELIFCTIWNAPDCGIVINAIVCKVMTLLFHMHINTRLYISEVSQLTAIYCSPNRSVTLPSNYVWHQKIAMKIIYQYISKNVWSFTFEGPICTNI